MPLRPAAGVGRDIRKLPLAEAGSGAAQSGRRAAQLIAAVHMETPREGNKIVGAGAAGARNFKWLFVMDQGEPAAIGRSRIYRGPEQKPRIPV